MIAMCGLDCAACPVYRATQKNDDEKRAKVAELWSKMFGRPFTIDEINCDGCLSGSDTLFGHCKSCVVRLCGMEKGHDTCAACADYSCAKLDGLLSFIPNPAARQNLEARRKG
ncbi:MAG: DUF3795 domain-containing protein [Spirochaetes bacterium]|nr:MAG: DUF3795 domain-containing protein [Spirochaetota bacterium]